jgi:hypothetical protein
MSRKVTVEVKHRLQLVIDEGVEVKHVMDEMDCTFVDQTLRADVVGDEMLDYVITDSK